ncbi:MAG: hypothetical protein JO043_08965 [Candidatus Eremiobacteraeota bacterium]|nr:hypothetical protein [Candidatus Eremiobacteraeota bacterium]
MEDLMRKTLFLVSSLALLVSLPISVSATLSPGAYEFNVRNGVFQELCLLPSLNWYSFTFSGLGGHWLNTKSNTNIFGTGSASQGNVSVVVNKLGTIASWTQWTSNLSFFNVVEPLKVVFVSGCSASMRPHPGHLKLGSPLTLIRE